MKVNFKFSPYQHVKVKPLDAPARVTRCIDDGGEYHIYTVCYYINGDVKFNDFYSDELEAVE